MDRQDASLDGSVLMTNENKAPPPLQAEIQTAHAAFKTALLQLGLLTRFQRDVRTLGVQDYASKPPSNMTNALLQASKDYIGACNSMEAQIMRARAALLYEADGGVDPVHPGTSNLDRTKDTVMEAVDQSKAGEAQEDSVPSPGLPEELSLLQPPPDRAESTSLLNDAEMEDLFGPGTAKTDLSMISAPANAGSQQAQSDPSMLQGYESHSVGLAPSLSTPTFAQDFSLQTDSAFQGQVPPSATSQSFDPAASMFDFNGNNGMDSADTALPSTNFDFSHMSSDDFNSLLATLGASGGDVQGEGGNDLLQGLNLDTDLSSYLNTDFTSNP